MITASALDKAWVFSPIYHEHELDSSVAFRFLFQGDVDDNDNNKIDDNAAAAAADDDDDDDDEYDHVDDNDRRWCW